MFVDALGKTSVGKLDKKVLRSKYRMASLRHEFCFAFDRLIDRSRFDYDESQNSDVAGAERLHA
jgi:hypothetical protein